MGARAPTLLNVTMNEAKSLGDMLRGTAAKFGPKTALLIPGKSGFSPVSYDEMAATVRRYSAGIQSLGVNRGDRLVILSENCAEWAYADWACQCLGVISVPIYPTLPTDQTEYIVRDCGAKVVLAGSSELFDKVKSIEGVRSLLLKDSPESFDSTAKSEMPMADWNREIDLANSEDIATIIYTSGTTGTPKGAVIAHRAFTFLSHSALSTIPVSDTDVFLSFLPLSHVFERFAGHVLPISLGATIGYVKSLASLSGDMLKVKPTIMMVVPRLLESMMDRIVDGVRKQPPLKQKIFNLALSQGEAKARGRFAPLASVLSKVAGGPVREKVGGRLRFFVSGGAALPGHVASFYFGIGMPVLQGYGLTETCAATCINHPDRNRYWTVGEPLVGMEVSIAGDGEILIRGHGVMKGYYNLPEDSAAAIDPEGWFHTGDIGEFEGKNLKITDRKKDLLVLGNGKNIAPQPIENKLKSSPYITEAVLLGDGMDHCAALIVPNAEAVRSHLGLPEGAVISQSPEAKALIKQEIDRINKTLASFEIVKKHAILDNPFTVDSGEMTPTMKVKRKVVKEHYRDLIATL